jgi:predicted peroxiredoxin
MKSVRVVIVALAMVFGFVVVAASPGSAGSEVEFVVTVDGTVVCLPSGEAQITWLAEVAIDPATLPQRDALDSHSLAGVVFTGTQSGAAIGPVTFDPEEQLVPAENESFPLSSQAVALASGTSGGAVTLDVDVLIYNVNDPEEFFEEFGDGSVELPLCEQPVVTSTTEETRAAELTRPRFTG